jgi:hypothetical protein
MTKETLTLTTTREVNPYEGMSTGDFDHAWDIEFKVWNVEDEDFDCVYCSIYDWKEMGPECSSTGTYQWHIGGHRNKEHRADWLMMDLLELSDKPEYRFYPGFVQHETWEDAKKFVEA